MATLSVVDFPLSALISPVTDAEMISPGHDFGMRVGVNVFPIEEARVTGSTAIKSPEGFHPEILRAYHELFGTDPIEVGAKWIDAQQQEHTNGPQSCVLTSSNENGVVTAELGQTGYLVIKAWQAKVHKALLEGKLPLGVEPDQYREAAYGFMLEHQPKIAGGLVYALCEYQGEVCVVSQIKGPGTGYKQLHTSWVGRGINPKYLSQEDPVRAAQLDNIAAETGIDPSYAQKYLTPVRMGIDEPSTGNANFVSFLVGQPADFYLDSFRSFTEQQIVADTTLERLKQAGIALVPLQGISLIPLSDLGRFATPRTLAIIPHLDVDKEKILIPDAPIEVAVANRPHSDGFLGKVADPRFRELIIDIGMGAR